MRTSEQIPERGKEPCRYGGGPFWVEEIAHAEIVICHWAKFFILQCAKTLILQDSAQVTRQCLLNEYFEFQDFLHL